MEMVQVTETTVTEPQEHPWGLFPWARVDGARASRS